MYKKQIHKYALRKLCVQRFSRIRILEMGDVRLDVSQKKKKEKKKKLTND